MNCQQTIFFNGEQQRQQYLSMTGSMYRRLLEEYYVVKICNKVLNWGLCGVKYRL